MAFPSAPATQAKPARQAKSTAQGSSGRSAVDGGSAVPPPPHQAGSRGRAHAHPVTSPGRAPDPGDRGRVR